MKGLNLSSFKKIAEDKHSATMKHSDGHTIRLAKAALPMLQRKQLEKLPIHMDDGGNTGPISNGMTPEEAAQFAKQSQQTSSDTPPESLSEMFKNAAVTAVTPMEDSGNQSSASQLLMRPSTGTPNAPAPANTSTPLPNTTTNSDLPDYGKPVEMPKSTTTNSSIPSAQGLYNQGVKGISEQADAQAAIARQNAYTEQDYMRDRQAFEDQAQNNFKNFKEQQDLVMKDYMNGHIDPNHYQESRSTGQKVLSGIGMLLSGLGSGLAHQQNIAADYLQKQIDRDIQAQRDNLDQKRTLLGANQAIYHDQVLAENATRINLNDIYAHKIASAAADNGSATAQAAKDQALAKFGLENQQLLQQSAIRAAILQNGGRGSTPIELGNAGIIPKEQAIKEQAAFDGQKGTIESSERAYEDAKNQTVLQKVNPFNLHTGADLGIDQATLVRNLQASAPTKRYSEAEANSMIQPFLPNRTDPKSVIDDKKQGYLNMLRKESAGELPMSSQYINPPIQSLTNTAKPQYTVGQIVPYKQADGSIQKLQIIDTKGNTRIVK